MRKLFFMILAAALMLSSVSLAAGLENPSLPASFREAVEAAGENVAVGCDVDYLAAVAEKDGKIIRTVTLPDDHARELFMAAISEEDSAGAFEAYQEYAWSLPVTYTEEITARPKDRAELDALTGKTVGELMETGYLYYGAGYGQDLPSVVDLSCGIFIYTFEVDGSLAQYLENDDTEGIKTLTVGSAELSPVFSIATDPDWLADGTYAPQVVPNITAEEAAAVVPVPQADEYTAKAWPLTADGYADLLNNLEDRYGQEYLVEGTVHQVLSQSPTTVVVFTGEDGQSRPVIVAYPVYSSFCPEAGGTYRIYADVSSSCYILPVLTARYSFTCEDADPLPGEP